LLLSKDQTWTEERALEYIAQQCGVPDTNTVLISACEKWGFKKLLELIGNLLTMTATKFPETSSTE